MITISAHGLSAKYYWTRLLPLLLMTTFAFGDDTEVLLYPPDGVNVPQPGIFSAPVPVVDTSKTTHSGDLIFTLFQPERRPLWRGNIKRYRLGGRQTQTGTRLALYDVNGLLALDADTGLFNPESTSIWTPDFLAPDGMFIAKGGLASRLYAYRDGAPDADSRKVYTYAGQSLDLTHFSNALHEKNIANGIDPDRSLTKTLFAVTNISDAEFIELVRWARGVDVDDIDGDDDRDEGRLELGAPLHSRPSVLSIEAPDGSKQNLLFVLTNAGYLHAAVMDEADTDAPLERFAFVPPDQLPKLHTLKQNQAGSGDASSNHTLLYGLDGGLTTWFYDQQDDGVLDPRVDNLYVYFGLRRGGRQYYALDVTDLALPKLLWSLRGGQGEFAELAQTWSRPTHARMALQLTGDESPRPRDVIIFGGGYDPQHDRTGQMRHSDNTGRAIYLVDARSGNLLWWAGPAGHADDPDLGLADMRYAIPAPITTIDLNGDRLVDLFVVADLGGQVWRFDVIDGAIRGGVIADLQDRGDGNTDIADNRRFYEPVDVALANAPLLGDYLAIAMASGYRAHPLDIATHESVFVLRQAYPSGPAAEAMSYTKITAGDLLDITDRPDLNGNELTEEEFERYRNGWSLFLRNTPDREFIGEKVLAAPLIASNLLLFTSYIPDPQPGPYGPGPGRSRFYAIKLDNGRPVTALSGPGSDIGQLKVDDRFQDLPENTPPVAPVIVFPPLDALDPVVLVGTQITDLQVPATILPTFWYQDHVH